MAGLGIYLRGQIWDTDLEPVRGGEIQKKRPCVIISSDAIKKTDVRIVVPLTERARGYVDPLFHVPVDPSDGEQWEAKGLKKFGFADVLQVRCVSTGRFKEFLTSLKADKVSEIVDRLASVIEFEP